MISVEQAHEIIQAQNPEWGTCKLPIANCIDEVLAEDIYADLDFPSYDRITMDGITLSFDNYDKGQREYIIQGTQLAGQPPLTLKDDAHAIEIMTGAVLSHGCDLMIRYEDLEFFEKNGLKHVKIKDDECTQWKNIHKKGSDKKIGDLLIEKGCTISGGHIALLATVGCAEVLVNRKPKIAVISTGNELVDIDQTPLPHQIRKSNAVVIQASLNQLQIPNELFHLNDDKEELQKNIKQILEDFDVLLLSGGVSKGKVDYLPEVLDSLQVEKKFHRIAQRPGKPFWFGTSPQQKVVFAFPGNPISTYMCFVVYCIPWIKANIGMKSDTSTATLMEDVSFKPDLGYFLQVRTEVLSDQSLQATPQSGNGSGDLTNLALSDGFLYCPAGKKVYKAGNTYDFYSFA